MGLLTRPKGKVVPLDDDYNEKPVHLPRTPITESRKCRDLVFLVLFILLWTVNALVGSNAVSNGEPRRLMYDHY